MTDRTNKPSIALPEAARFGLFPPEDEDEEHEQHAERGHVVHGLHEHHQLPPQGWHEAHQLQDSEQPESPEHGQAAVGLAHDLAHAEERSRPGLAQGGQRSTANS